MENISGKKIKLLKKGAIKEISEKFLCTPETVTNALQNKYDTYLSMQIRKFAVENYEHLVYSSQQ